MQRIDIEIIADSEGLEAIRSEWQICFDRSDASPYLCYDWFRSYVAHLAGGADLRIVVARVDGRACAILPFEKIPVKIGPIEENVLRFAGDGFAPSAAGIVAADVEPGSVLRAARSALHREDRDWSFMRLSKVPVRSELARHFRSSAMPGSVQIDLPQSWQTYLQALPASRRYGIRRRVSGLERRHRVELVRVGLDGETGAERLRRVIDAALRVSAASWQNRADEGMAISDPRCRGFFTEASERMAALGALDLSVLYLDGEPVSFLWGLARGDYTSISKLGFDSAYARLSPGRAHIAMHIEDSIERGFSLIDFGHEFADQKRRWSDRECALCELWYFPPGFRASLYKAWYRVRRGVRPAPAA